MSRALIPLILVCLSGCAPRDTVFDGCNRQAWHAWAAQPHLAYAFGAVGALVDSSYTNQTASDTLRDCLNGQSAH